MKDQTPFPLNDPSHERFIDAALREHVRLGSANRDTDLIRSILSETVDRERPAAIRSPAKADDRRIWMIGIASAAAILAALATLLAALPFHESSRNTDEIRFIVQYGDAPESFSAPGFSIPPRQKDPAPFSGSIDIHIAHEPVETAIPSVSGAPLLDLAFNPSFSRIPEPGFREERLQIVADKTTELEGRLVYEGNVEVRHENFRLTSDHVELIRNDDEKAVRAVRLTSRNGLLEQTSPARKALAEQIDYEPSTNRFSLSGIAFLNSPEGHLSDFDRGDQIFLIGETLIVQKEAQAR